MALPIAPTPCLTGPDAERFDRVVAEGLQHKVSLVAPKVDWERIHAIQRNLSDK